MATPPALRALTILALSIGLISVESGGVLAKPCECKDTAAVNAEIKRARDGQAIWKEIFAWARGLRRGIAEPQSNEELNTRFLQLSRTPRSDWDRIFREPIRQIEQPKTAGGLSQSGEVVVDHAFAQAHCDEIVEGVRIHEREHGAFFHSPATFMEATLKDSSLLKIRAESEVVSYRAQEAFLQKVLEALKSRCNYTITAISRWHVDGPANQKIAASLQDAELTELEAGRYEGTATVSWVMTVDRMVDCTATITVPPSQATLKARVEGLEMFVVDVTYQPATASSESVCQNAEATLRGTREIQLAPDPITVSVPVSGGATRQSHGIQGPGAGPGDVILSARRGSGQ